MPINPIFFILSSLSLFFFIITQLSLKKNFTFYLKNAKILQQNKNGQQLETHTPPG
jgi:hypothetical protein